MRSKKERDAVYGAWEEPNVIGTRVEIDRRRVQILWQGGVVLDTAYTAEENDGRILLRLKKTGLRYKNDFRDYATVTAIYYAQDALHLCETFPVTGESETVLRKTDNTRFGNYDFADEEILPLLQGEWHDANGFGTLCFRGDLLTIDAHTTRIRVLKSRSTCANGGYLIVDADPAVRSVHHFCDMTYLGEEITAVLPVCDASPCVWHFQKG